MGSAWLDRHPGLLRRLAHVVSSQPDPHDPALVRLSLCAGLVVGLVLALVLAWRWTEAGAGTRIQVLGAGKYASVLITQDQRRILIASGSNGSAFSNAISNALPAIGEEIDVLLIDPRSSADVVDRARSLDAKRALVLPGAGFENGAEIVQRSFTIELTPGVALAVRIEPDNSWTAEVTTPAGAVAITPGRSASTAQVWISLDGAFGASESDPQVRIGPASNGLARTQMIATVRAGTVLSIRIDGSMFRIPRSFFAANVSGERADHLARLDREFLLELGPDRLPELLVAHNVQSSQGHRFGNADRVLISHL